MPGGSQLHLRVPTSPEVADERALGGSPDRRATTLGGAADEVQLRTTSPDSAGRKSPRKSIFAVAKDLQVKKAVSGWRSKISDFFGVSDDAHLERWHRVFDVSDELEGGPDGAEASEAGVEGEELSGTETETGSESEGMTGESEEGDPEGEGSAEATEEEEEEEEAGLAPLSKVWGDAVRSLMSKRKSRSGPEMQQVAEDAMAMEAGQRAAQPSAVVRGRSGTMDNQRSTVAETQIDGSLMPSDGGASSGDEVGVGNKKLFQGAAGGENDEWFGGSGMIVRPLTGAASTPPAAAVAGPPSGAGKKTEEWFGGSGMVVMPVDGAAAAGAASAPPPATQAARTGAAGRSGDWFGFDPSNIKVVAGKSPPRSTASGSSLPPPVVGSPPPVVGSPPVKAPAGPSSSRVAGGAVSGASSAAAHRRSKGHHKHRAHADNLGQHRDAAVGRTRHSSPTKPRDGNRGNPRGSGSSQPPGPVSGVRSSSAHRRRARGGSGAIAHKRRSAASLKKNRKYGTETRKQLDSIREHRPFFTYYMSFCQVVIMIVTLITYQLAPISFTSQVEVDQVAGKDGGVVTVNRTVAPNFWIGPNPDDLVLLGAKFDPCFRKDVRVQDEIINPQNDLATKMGCCMDQGESGGNCFSATEEGCQGFKVWSSEPCGGPQCCKDFNGESSPTYPRCSLVSANSTTETSCKCAITARPCCFGLVGRCEIQSLEWCDYQGGTWHDEAITCDQVACLEDSCGLIKFANSGVPDQWYRLYLALFIHVGLIHLFFVLLFQHSIAVDIEKLSGWLRMSFIYMLSGVGGYTVSAVFTPYQVSTGASPALYGLLGCLFVELFQSWQLLDSPKYEFCKLITIAIIALGIGLLPYVDNWSQLGGFVFGILSSIVFLPYITFGKWDAARKRTLICIAFPGVIGLLTLFIVLTATNSLVECSWCGYLNCVDFTPNFCAENQQNVMK